MLKKFAKQYFDGTHCGGLQLPVTHTVSLVVVACMYLDHLRPLIQTEILPSLDHAPFLAFAEGTTCRALVIMDNYLRNLRQLTILSFLKQKVSMALTTFGFFLPQMLRSCGVGRSQASASWTRQRQATTTKRIVMKLFMVSDTAYATVCYYGFGCHGRELDGRSSIR